MKDATIKKKKNSPKTQEIIGNLDENNTRKKQKTVHYAGSVLTLLSMVI